MNYYTYQSHTQGCTYQVQEHATPSEQASFWQAWHAASDTTALAEYIRDHLNARKVA